MNKRVSRERPIDVADRMARDIQSGALAPGMWLKQIELEERYGATRIEIRRALDRLALRRLVKHIPNRGYHVFATDRAELREILQIRCILETAAADPIVANAGSAAIARLDGLARAFDQLILTGTLLEQYEANLAFHEALLDLCGNRQLTKLVGELRCRTSSAPATQWRTRARIEQSGREHHAMVAALAARDASQLKAILAVHIQQPSSVGGRPAIDAGAGVKPLRDSALSAERRRARQDDARGESGASRPRGRVPV